MVSREVYRLGGLLYEKIIFNFINYGYIILISRMPK